jgi:soluble P-type ATPase
MGTLFCHGHVLPPGEQAGAKHAHVKRRGAGETVAVGNGRNDRRMLDQAALGIAGMTPGGAAVETLLAADIVSDR